MEKPLLRVLRIIVSVSLLVFLISRTNVTGIVSTVKSSHLFFLLLAFFIYIFTVFIISYRWHILLRTQEVNLPFKSLISFYFIGFFFNNFLPTSVGGDVFRAYGAAKESGRKAISLASVVVERLVGLLAIASLALLSLVFVAQEMSEQYIPILIIGFFLILVVLVFTFFNKRVFNRLKYGLSKITVLGLGGKLLRLSESIGIYREHFNALLTVFVTSLIYQLFIVVFNYMVSEALNLQLSIIHFTLFVPIIAVVCMFPVSINAIGIREAGYTFLLSRVGRSSFEALSLSLIIYGISVIASLIGGVLFAVHRIEFGNTNNHE